MQTIKQEAPSRISDRDRDRDLDRFSSRSTNRDRDFFEEELDSMSSFTSKCVD